MTAPAYLLGIDIGGTFTDIVIADEDGGRLESSKVLTTQHDPILAVASGVRSLLDHASISPDRIQRVVHATTLATNLVLEGAGSPVAYVTTEGFGDIPRIGRESRFGPSQYDLFFVKDQVPVGEGLIYEVSERVSSKGEVLRPLAEDSLSLVCEALADRSPRGVAVCLINSYANPSHERRVAEELRRLLPDAHVAASFEVWPEFREFDRAMTTIVSAYVGPVLAEYLTKLSTTLEDIGIRSPLQVMQSNGGIIGGSHASRRAVYCVESGPAAGVVAASFLGRLRDEPDVIAFDMGGTTAKAGLVVRGEATITNDFRLGGAGSISSAHHSSGIPIQIPVIDLAEVGSGGGSVAWVDAGGALQVGPRSAGADPGPACYDRGGNEPTVTDADLVLGYLNPNRFAGGEMKLSYDKARDAIEDLAGALAMDWLDVAAGIHAIANMNMSSAIRTVTVQRGIDPRGFAAVASGGAGPAHIVRVATEFDISRIYVPRQAGVMSAIGLITSDFLLDVVTSLVVPLEQVDPGELATRFDRMEQDGLKQLAGDGVSAADVTVRRSIEVRYRHQSYGINVPIARSELDPQSLSCLRRDFFDAYMGKYGVRWEGPTEIMNLRCRLAAEVPKLRGFQVSRTDDDPAAALSTRRPAHFAEAGGFVETPVYDWDLLQPGQRTIGPAIFEHDNSTVVLPPGFEAVLDEDATLRIGRLPSGPLDKDRDRAPADADPSE